jgi:hypothetical protein
MVPFAHLGCVFVCVCVYTNGSFGSCVYMCVCIHITHLSICMYVCMCMCIYIAHLSICMWVYMHTYTHIHIPLYGLCGVDSQGLGLIRQTIFSLALLSLIPPLQNTLQTGWKGE